MASSRATRVLSLTRRPFSSSSSLKFDAGVSMVQGASRGIGLEFVKQLLEKNDKGHVVATCRNPDASTGLAQLKDKFAESLKLLPLDLTVETSIQASASSVRETYGHLNLLINASGILSIPQVLQPVSKTAAVEFAREKDPIVCILLHPGTVDTDLSKPFQKNVPKEKLFSKEFSVQKLLSIIDNVKSNDNGKFFAWDGQEIPW
ncbi:hypothetical protein Ahy_A03g014428 [Arachis hypogaea]|uniref:Uncharacterized protein n=1 Tax=Arachis hypogaea TaxID=3818 RepID=A0A445DXN6_ARAHY|nr:hypothetical protein Ahy_A03g014428 [Arachis hypogaea]